jgi:uncharacterized protein (TIGR00375 family)
MKIFSDLHIHSKYSRATSQNMDIRGISEGAKLKGLNLVGTGDFTHPSWFSELKKELEEIDDSGIFRSKQGMNFLLTSEVSNVFEKNGETKKIHNLILVKNFDVAKQVIEYLSRYGDLKKDGRPTISLSCSEMVEVLKQLGEVEIIPCHIWTPWFSLFGSKSGFDSVKDCYVDQTKKLLALETGLSSDPAMNWRLSQLDDFALVSFSDSHSPHPWRIGRELCVFDCELTFDSLVKTIRRKNPKKFLFTVEVDPSYGKYHWDGHRKCNVCLHPKEAEKYGNICPVCKKPLTIGVLHRVEQLADREEGYKPKNAIPFKRLLPLYEVISYSIGEARLYSKKVENIESELIQRFGSELNVLLNAEPEEIKKIAGEKVARGIMLNREEKVKVIPGYDGVYGKPVFEGKAEIKSKVPQKRIDVFF